MFDFSTDNMMRNKRDQLSAEGTYKLKKFGSVLSFIPVRMKLLCQLSVRFSNKLGRGTLANSKHLIEIVRDRRWRHFQVDD